MVFYNHFVQNLWGVIYLSLHRSTGKIQLKLLCESPTHTAVNKQQEPNSTYMGLWIFSWAEGFYLSTFSYCNYSSQVWSTSFTSIASALLDLQSTSNPAYSHVKKKSPIMQWAPALLMLYVFLRSFLMLLLRSIHRHGTLAFQYCQQSKNFNSKPLKFTWTWWAFDGVAFLGFFSGWPSFNCPQIHGLPEKEHGVWLPWQSRPHHS